VHYGYYCCAAALVSCMLVAVAAVDTGGLVVVEEQVAEKDSTAGTSGQSDTAVAAVVHTAHGHTAAALEKAHTGPGTLDSHSVTVLVVPAHDCCTVSKDAPHCRDYNS
jgi:hypothetical protein